MDLTQFAIGQGILLRIVSFLNTHAKIERKWTVDLFQDTQPTTKIIECKIWAVDCRKGWRRMVTPKGVCDILASHSLKHEMANNTFREISETMKFSH